MQRRLILVAGWLLPVLLATLFFMKGRSYNPAFFTPPALSSSALPFPASVGDWTLEGAQTLPSERMFEKINGKADYYLQYGAIDLSYGEWVADGQRWDMYLYRFEEAQGARRAYRGERPASGQAMQGEEGYTVPGQATLVAGCFYLQLNAQERNADTDPAVDLALALVPALSTGTSADAGDTVGLSELAADDAVPQSEEYIPGSAFGFSSLSKVEALKVSLGGEETTWFTAPGNADTIAAYAEELAMYGGEQIFSRKEGVGGSMFGAWSFVTVSEGAVWGINNAPSQDALMHHWEVMKRRLLQEERTP